MAYVFHFAGWVYGSLCESGQPSRLSSPCRHPARDWFILHSMVLCVSSPPLVLSLARTCVLLCMNMISCCVLDSMFPDISHEVTSTKFSRYLLKELLISLWSALFMGFGILFLLLWVGIYVWRTMYHYTSLVSRVHSTFLFMYMYNHVVCTSSIPCEQVNEVIYNKHNNNKTYTRSTVINHTKHIYKSTWHLSVPRYINQ